MCLKSYLYDRIVQLLIRRVWICIRSFDALFRAAFKTFCPFIRESAARIRHSPSLHSQHSMIKRKLETHTFAIEPNVTGTFAITIEKKKII